MTESSESRQVAGPEEALRALKRLVVGNEDLERLEAILSDFNPFVAMGWVRQELRHSAFLSWLLDPSESHGLGTYPLRTFLKEILFSAGSLGPDAPNVFDADSWDLSRTHAHREWEKIDVFLRNDEDGFTVVVENKVDAGETGDQLSRYHELVKRQFPRHRHLFVFLSPSGDPPSHEDYVPVSYAAIANLVDRIRQQREGQLSVEVGTFITQYVEMVRRHIVEESEIQELCKRLYENHRVALDLIFEHRPDRALLLTERIQALVREHGLIPEQTSKALIRFVTPTLDRFPRGHEGWLRSKRLVVFEVENYASKVYLKLILGPCEAGLRTKVRDHVSKHPTVFNKAKHKLYPKWWTFHGERWVSKKQYDELDLDEVEALVADRMNRLVRDFLPRMDQALLPLIEKLEK